MKDWLIKTELGETRFFIVRQATRQDAIQQVENEADFEMDDDMDGDYVVITEIKPGQCVEIMIDD